MGGCRANQCSWRDLDRDTDCGYKGVRRRKSVERRTPAKMAEDKPKVEEGELAHVGTHEEDKEKLWQILKGIDYAMIVTIDHTDGNLRGRLMTAVQKVSSHIACIVEVYLLIGI